jgi:hypothetical protein
VFQRSHLKQARRNIAQQHDAEKQFNNLDEKALAPKTSDATDIGLERQTAIFHWSDGKSLVPMTR